MTRKKFLRLSLILPLLTAACKIPIGAPSPTPAPTSTLPASGQAPTVVPVERVKTPHHQHHKIRPHEHAVLVIHIKQGHTTIHVNIVAQDDGFITVSIQDAGGRMVAQTSNFQESSHRRFDEFPDLGPGDVTLTVENQSDKDEDLFVEIEEENPE